MNWSWIFKMAWRDSRKNRSRLFLFISSIILGIASLVAIQSFNENLSRNIDEQAAQLLGADLELETNRKPNEETQQFLDSIAGLSIHQAHEQEFMSMVLFPKAEGSRLIQVRAITGVYPFYGQLQTFPLGAGSEFHQHSMQAADAGALVDQSLMIQFEAQVGDTIQLGNTRLPIAGILTAQPGKSAVSGALAPAIMVPLDALAHSGLQQTGSRIEYKYYYRFADNYPVDAMIEGLETRLRQLQLRSETIQTNKDDTGRSFADMTSFMGIVGFIALLLGCIGVSSAIHIYVREKMVSVAILRCLGASIKQTFFIFLIQFAGIGLLGGLAGAILGTLIQFLVPLVMQNFVPVSISGVISWLAILEGIIVGLVISVLFALLPLMAVRNITPLHSLRVSDDTPSDWKDRSRWLIYILIAGFIIGFAYLQLGNWWLTLAFSLGIAIIFVIFYTVAKLFTYLLRRYFPQGLPYVWRQGMANLYRPQNQTVVLLVAIGFGTALVATLFFVQDMLLKRVNVSAEQQEANMVLFDIQPSQLERIRQITTEAGYPVLDEVPIVTVQLVGAHGRTASEILADTTEGNEANRSARAMNREIRATFRADLTSSEQLIDGTWIGQTQPGDTAQVSLEVGYAERIGVKPGDKLEFNVQGVIMPAIVSSTREVDWNQFSTNFRMVFADGAINDAPRFYVMMTHIADTEESARFQQNLLRAFPTVSVVDINSVMDILNDLMTKVSFVIQFIGSFSILTGIVVLIASIRISKYQRVRENVLLRTIGASRRQIFLINISEYLLLGLLAAFVGLIIAIGASTLLGQYIFDIRFIPSIGITLTLLFSVAALTAIIGVLNSLGTLNHPPLEILRQ